MALEMPLLKGLVSIINPLLIFYRYASDFGALNHLKRRLINVNSNVCKIMLNNKQIQVGSLVMKFG